MNTSKTLNFMTYQDHLFFLSDISRSSQENQFKEIEREREREREESTQWIHHTRNHFAKLHLKTKQLQDKRKTTSSNKEMVFHMPIMNYLGPIK